MLFLCEKINWCNFVLNGIYCAIFKFPLILRHLRMKLLKSIRKHRRVMVIFKINSLKFVYVQSFSHDITHLFPLMPTRQWGLLTVASLAILFLSAMLIHHYQILTFKIKIQKIVNKKFELWMYWIYWGIIPHANQMNGEVLLLLFRN